MKLLSATRWNSSRLGYVGVIGMVVVAIAALFGPLRDVLTQQPQSGAGPSIIHDEPFPLPVELSGTGAPIPESLRPQTRPFGRGSEAVKQHLAEIKAEGGRVQAVICGWEAVYPGDVAVGAATPTALAVSPDGTLIAESNANTLLLRPTRGGASQWHTGAGAGARRIVFSADGSRIAAAGNPEWPNAIRVFEAASGALELAVGHPARAEFPVPVALDGTGRYVTDGRQVWDRMSGFPADLPETLSGSAVVPPTNVALSRDGSRIAVVRGLSHRKIYDQSTRQLHDIPLPRVAVTAIGFDPDGNLGLGDDEGNFWFVRFDTTTTNGNGHAELILVHAHRFDAAVTAVAASRPREFALGAADGSVGVVQIGGDETRPRVVSLPAQWVGVAAVALTNQPVTERRPSGETETVRKDFVITVADDRSGRVYDLRDRQFAQALPDTSGGVHLIVGSPDGMRVVVVFDRVAQLWRIPPEGDPFIRHAQIQLRHRPETAAFTTDGKWLIFANGNAIEVFDAETADRRHAFTGDVTQRRCLAIYDTWVVTGPNPADYKPLGRPQPDVVIRDAKTGDILAVVPPENLDAADPNAPVEWQVGDSAERLPPPTIAAAVTGNGQMLILGRASAASAQLPLTSLFRLDGLSTGHLTGYRRPRAGESPSGLARLVLMTAAGETDYVVARDGDEGVIIERYRLGERTAPTMLGRPGDLPGQVSALTATPDGSFVAAADSTGKIVVVAGDGKGRMAAFQLPSADVGRPIRLCLVRPGRLIVGTGRGALLALTHETSAR